MVFIARMTRGIIKILMRGKQICSYWSDLIIINQWTYKAEEIRKISRKRKNIFSRMAHDFSQNLITNYVVNGMPNVALFDILYLIRSSSLLLYIFIFVFTLYSLLLHIFIFEFSLCSFLLYLFCFYSIFDHLYSIFVHVYCICFVSIISM